MKIGTIYDITFSTNRADTGALANADSTPVVRVTEDGVNLAYLPTVSSLSTGIYIVSINTSSGNGFEVGKRYSVYATATVNAINGAIGLDSFTMETRGIDDVLPTASYTTPPTTANIRTELTPELTLINTNLDVPVSSVGGGGGGGLTTEEHNHLMGLSQFSGSGIIDRTLSHEEILKKFDKLLKKELKDIIDSMKAPTIDLGPIERAIQGIKPTDISGFMQGISDIKIHIKNLSENVVKEYEKKKAEIEMKYRDEIEKKNSLLKENEYNLKEKQGEIEKMSGNIQDLLKEIDTINKEKEEEIQIIEDTYLDKIEKVKIEKEEEIVEKVIPLLS